MAPTHTLEPHPSRRTWLQAGALVLLAPAQRVASAADLQHWPRGQAAPPLSLPAWQGTAWSLVQGRGQALLLHFWGTWCEPCRDELPALQAFAQRHAAEGLQVITVSARDSEAALARFAQQLPLTLPVLMDRDGRVAKAWGVRLFPSTVAVGRDGRPRFVLRGAADWPAEPRPAWLSELLRA